MSISEHSNNNVVCGVEAVSTPSIMVIFGGSGDLTRRKLIPALYKLKRNGLLPAGFSILTIGRRTMSVEEYRGSLLESMESMGIDAGYWEIFSKDVFYHSLDYGDLDDYRGLNDRLEGMGKDHDDYNYIFYLATPPSAFGVITENLGKCGLSDEENGWRRIVIEKPFGSDLESARELDNRIKIYFREDQIFRIDHYLGKETVQDILMFRFANTIFEPVWNRQYIDYIQITAAETLGIGRRAGYYDRIGVLRDMFQNHILQLLALTAMEAPAHFDPECVHDEKVKVFKSIKPIPLERLEDFLVLGQYREGVIDGRDVPGYLDEPGVPEWSRTPTFAAMKVFIENWRWQGVPFYLRSGKRMEKRLTQIAVRFKKVPYMMFRDVLGEEIGTNMIVLRIQPDEGIGLKFQIRLPGSKICTRSVMMDFSYSDFYEGTPFEAYERVLLDVMLGDHLLFIREDGVDAAWALLTPVLKAVETEAGTGRLSLEGYSAGSWGPPLADRLVQEGGDEWVVV